MFVIVFDVLGTVSEQKSNFGMLNVVGSFEIKELAEQYLLKLGWKDHGTGWWSHESTINFPDENGKIIQRIVTYLSTIQFVFPPGQRNF